MRVNEKYQLSLQFCVESELNYVKYLRTSNSFRALLPSIFSDRYLDDIAI